MKKQVSKGTLFILFFSVFLGMMGLGIVIPLLPIMVQNYGESGFWVGALFAAYGISRIILTPSIGSWSERFGRKWFITGGLALYTLVSIFYLFQGSIYELFAIRFVHGIASAMISTCAMAYVADLTPKGEEGLYQGKLSNYFYLGMGFGPIIGGVMNNVFGMDSVFILMAIMSLIPCILCIKLLPESRPEVIKPKSVIKAFLHPRMQSVLFFRFFNCFPYSAFMVYLPVIAIQQYGFSTSLSGVIVAIEVISMAMTQGYFGKKADSLKKSHMIIFGTFILSFATLALPYLSHFIVIAIIALLIGIGNAIAISSATAVVAIDGRELGQGVVMGAFNTIVSFGIVIPPLIFGVVSVVASLDAVFILAAVVSLITLIPFWFLVQRSKKLVGYLPASK